MAHIKCRYTTYHCPYGEVYGNCFDKFDSDCDHFISDPKSKVINPKCEHILVSNMEFEKTVRTYEVEISRAYDKNGYLEIGRTVIDESDIDYLEIDGRVLIDKEGGTK